jgi:hypothetical protein
MTAFAINATPPDGLLWHYTDFNGLHGMVAEDHIRASGIAYLNDAAEFKYTIDIARPYLEPGTVKLGDIGLFLTREDVPKFVQQVLDRARRSGVFVMSLSRKADDLSQWRAYSGAGTGFSLGFARDALETLGRDQYFEMVDCEYDLAAQENEVKDVVESTYEAMAAEERGLNRADAVQRDRFFDKWSFQLFQNLERAAVRNKSPKFIDEGEVRLVMRPSMRPKGLPRLAVKFRQPRTMIVPYVEIPARRTEGPSPMKCILVGPCAHSEEVIDATHQMLSEHHVNATVMPSSIPFRNW